MQVEALQWERFSLFYGPWAFASIAKAEDNLYIFGGVQSQSSRPNNSTFVFSLLTHNWAKLEGSFEMFKLAPGSFVSSEGIYSFSGLNPDSMSINSEVNFFSFESKSWTTLQGGLEVTDYSSVQNGTNFYLFGGRGPKGLRNSLLVFDQDSNEFDTLVPEYANPGSRNHASLATVSKFLLLFGGSSGQAKFNDLWKYDLAEARWEQIQTQGKSPSPRSHAGIAYEGDVLVVWGGQGEEAYLNDAFLYSFSASTWFELPAPVFTPNQRFGLCLALSFPSLYLFGGSSYDGSEGNLLVFDFETETYQVDEERVNFDAGFNQHCELVKSEGELLLYVVLGASDLDKPLGYIQKYSFSSRTWKLLFSFENPALNRSDSVVKIVQDKVYVFGGVTRGGRVSQRLTVINLVSRRYEDFEVGTRAEAVSSATCYVASKLYGYGGGRAFAGFLIPESSSSAFFHLNLNQIENKALKAFCSPGSYVKAGKCEFCPAGTYNELYGQSACLGCPEGTENVYLGGSSRRQCTPCNAGFYSNSSGQSRCLKCPESYSCPVGSTYYSLDSKADSTSTDQPGALSRQTAEATRIGALIQMAVIVVGAVVLLILFTTEKTRKIVITIDIYNQLHNYQLDVIMYFRKTFCGSVFSMIFIILALILLIQTLILYFMDNTAEEKSLIPMVILQERVDNFYSDMTVQVDLFNYGGVCTEASSCSNSILFDDYNLDYDSSQIACSASETSCSIKLELSNCKASPGSKIEISLRDPNAFSSSIKVRYESGSSIPDKSSSITAELVAEQGKMFRGKDATVFSYTLTPSLFDFDGSEKTGYHVALKSNPSAGSTISPAEFAYHDYQFITLLLTEDINSLFIFRYTIYTAILLIMALIGSVVGIMKILGGAMAFVESNSLAQQAKRQRNSRLQGLKDNRKTALNNLTTDEDKLH